MLIAIPSVTQQITNSRKNSYIDTASSYVSAVVVKVNEGVLPLFDTNRLYLIPVGNDENLSCVSLESGGASPFSKVYNYAYVAVHYTGDSYDYWFLSEDGSLQGFEITPTKTLETAKKDLVKSGMKEIAELKASYSFVDTSDSNKVKSGTGFESCSDDTVCDDQKYNNLTNTSDASGEALKAFAGVLSGYSSIQVFNATECRAAFD